MPVSAERKTASITAIFLIELSSGRDAVESALALEIVAEMALRTLQLNPNAQQVERHLLDKHFFRKHGANAYYGQK